MNVTYEINVIDHLMIDPLSLLDPLLLWLRLLPRLLDSLPIERVSWELLFNCRRAMDKVFGHAWAIGTVEEDEAASSKSTPSSNSSLSSSLPARMSSKEGGFQQVGVQIRHHLDPLAVLDLLKEYLDWTRFRCRPQRPLFLGFYCTGGVLKKLSRTAVKYYFSGKWIEFEVT